MIDRRKYFINMSFKVRYLSLLLLPSLFLAIVIFFTGFLTTANDIIGLIENWNPASRVIEQSVNRLESQAKNPEWPATEEEAEFSQRLAQTAKQQLAIHNYGLETASRLPAKYAVLIAIEALIYIIVTFYIGSKLINKVIGPVHRLNTTIQRIATGDMGAKIRLRKGDELIPLADGLNQLTEVVTSYVEENRERMTQVEREVEEILQKMEADSHLTTQLADKLKQIDQLVKTSRQSMDWFNLPEKIKS